MCSGLDWTYIPLVVEVYRAHPADSRFGSVFHFHADSAICMARHSGEAFLTFTSPIMIGDVKVKNASPE